MALSDCPYDEETGLWVASSRWITQCARCGNGIVAAQVTLADHNAGAEEHRWVCELCAQYYIKCKRKVVIS